MQRLRETFVRSLNDEREVAGCFSFDETTNELTLSEEFDGFEGNDWIGSSSSKNCPFTFHTHPLFYEGEETPSNCGSAVFLSGEDLVGLVADDVRNKHFLANADGVGVFDVVLTIAGLLIVGASQRIIDLWGSMAMVSEDNIEEWMREYRIKRRATNRSVESVKEAVSKAAFAEVENGFNFHAMKRHCGAYGYFGRGLDTVFDRLSAVGEHAGYACWWPKKLLPEDERTEWDTSTPENRALAVKHVQLRWFLSDEFLKVDILKKDERLRAYVQGLNREGFPCVFCPWKLKGDTEFLFPIE